MMVTEPKLLIIRDKQHDLKLYEKYIYVPLNLCSTYRNNDS